MKRALGDAGFLDWARFPPVSSHRDPWEAAICECVEAGDDRFVPILRMHVEQGVIRSERAKAALGTADAAA